MRIPLIITVTLAAVAAELWLGNFAVALPLAACAVFYFTAAWGYRFGLLALLLCGLAPELILQRNFLLALAPLGVYWLALYWRAGGRTRSLAAAMLPGLLIGPLALGPLYLWRLWALGWRRVGFDEMAACILFAMFFCAFWLPLAVRFLDWIAERLGLPQYRGLEQ